MIRYAYIAPEKAAREFAEWASLFRGKIFVKIVVYADESGTHDPTGKLKGSREAMVAGYAAPVEDWVQFCGQWQAVLNKYKARYFHFCEWADAYAVTSKKRQPASTFKDNPYRHMDLRQLNSFILELAKIAGSGNKVIIGMGVHTQMFQERKGRGDFPKDSNPYLESAKKFFDEYIFTIKQQKPVWKRMPVSFFFDHGNKNWMKAICEYFASIKQKFPHFVSLTFEDKQHDLPIQAADMVSYRARQIVQNWVDDTVSANWAEFDELVFKPAFDLFDRNPKLVSSGLLIGELIRPRSSK